METYTTRLEKSGRILIPAAVRRQLGLSEGSQVLVKVEESGTLQVTSRSQALSKVREEIRRYIPAGQDLAGELIRDRRAEVEREDEGATSASIEFWITLKSMLSIWPKWLGGWCVPGCRRRGPSRPFTNCIWKWRRNLGPGKLSFAACCWEPDGTLGCRWETVFA